MLGWQAQVVKGVPHLVDRTEERRSEIFLVIVGGDADVTRPNASRERVGSGIEPALVEIVAQAAQNFAAELVLGGDRVVAQEALEFPVTGPDFCQ